eukprot:6184495-Prymnesium_polylepis.2
MWTARRGDSPRCRPASRAPRRRPPARQCRRGKVGGSEAGGDGKKRPGVRARGLAHMADGEGVALDVVQQHVLVRLDLLLARDSIVPAAHAVRDLHKCGDGR